MRIHYIQYINTHEHTFLSKVKESLLVTKTDVKTSNPTSSERMFYQRREQRLVIHSAAQPHTVQLHTHTHTHARARSGRDISR